MSSAVLVCDNSIFCNLSDEQILFDKLKIKIANKIKQITLPHIKCISKPHTAYKLYTNILAYKDIISIF